MKHYYLHYVDLEEGYFGLRHWAVLTRGVARKGAVWGAGFVEGPFKTREQALVRARWMNVKVINPGVKEHV